MTSQKPRSAPSELLPVHSRVSFDGNVIEVPVVLETDPNSTDTDEEDGTLQDITGAERVRRAIMLRLSGATYEQIARALDYSSPETARVTIAKAVAAVQLEAGKELKRIHHMRLEHMLMLLWPSVNAGDLQSMSAAVGIMDRLERLHGLNFVPMEQEGPSGDTVLVVGGEKESFMAALEAARKGRG